MNPNKLPNGTISGLLLGVMLFCVPNCNAGPMPAAGCCCCQSSGVEKTTMAAGGSLSTVADKWETDAGKKIKLSDLNGRVRVISMFYSTCQGVCVTTKEDLQQIEASLSPTARQTVGFVLVTLDPARDTDAVLREYRRAENLSPRRWTLLRGENDATTKLALLLGVTAGRDASGRFIHSSELVVLDPAGRIIHRHNGLHADLSAITSEIETAALAQTPKT